ncbi:hypothetical protein CR513_20371, partial [Mucuna pruriens]
MDLDKSFSSTTSPPIYKKTSNLGWCRDSKPYKLQWLSEKGELVVYKQVSLAIALGKYKDEIMCYVVPMEVIHILLGRH